MTDSHCNFAAITVGSSCLNLQEYGAHAVQYSAGLYITLYLIGLGSWVR